MTTDLYISIIITTKNEEKNIEHCLRSIAAQTISKDTFEVIVVDNHSNDRTKEIARQYTDLVYDYGPERSAQRNYGMMKKARGEWLLFLDADMILSPNLLYQAVVRVKHNNLIGLYLPEIILGQNYFPRVRRFERSFYDGTVIDCVRFIKKTEFKKVGGFDLNLTGPEDWDLDKKIRQQGPVSVLSEYDFKEIDSFINASPFGQFMNLIDACTGKNSLGHSGILDCAVIYHNEADFSLSSYLNKKKYYSQTVAAYINKWDKDDPDIKKQFGLLYRYFIVFFENGKWKRFIKYPDLVFGMYLLRCAIGCIYLKQKLL